MKQWLQHSFHKNIIPNFSLKECQNFLGESNINIENYLLVCVGRNKYGLKHVAFFHLEFCQNGKKIIHVYHQGDLLKPISMEIESLSSIRSKLFGFTDRLSFERSTFLILFNIPCLIRLKCLRGICKSIFSSSSRHCYIRSRTKLQLERVIEQIFTAYVRDLKDIEIFNNEKIIELLLQDIITLLSKMKSYLN
jgi:hypothetical protein